MNRKCHLDDDNAGVSPVPSQTHAGHMTGAQAAKFFRNAADVVERYAHVDGSFTLNINRRRLNPLDMSMEYGYEESAIVRGSIEGCRVRTAIPTKKVYVGGQCSCGHHVIPGAHTCWRCGREAPSKEES